MEEKDEKLEVGGGGVSCRSSVTRSLFHCWAEFKITLLWTNRKPTIRLTFRPSPEHEIYIQNRMK